MKKAICLFLCAATLLAISACGKNNERAQETLSGTTLMIYMVGSDLEAKGSAGTKDMQEIIESQVDLSCNNVLLYAGGTKKWHNDTISAESGHAILQLTPEGFQVTELRDEASMGDAQTLAYFLNYAYNNYAAEEYALILWDHGNGPLIGYGKDMLHENDSLTLLEMQEALGKSPFTGSNKLAWVGFDACLMSSVELACIWQEHADYLIASQEIEPSFGWNYSFLQNLGKVNATDLADSLTSCYMESCLQYYERRNFDQRDTTLACMDLSKVSALRSALDELFTKAQNDVRAMYSELAATRVSTRALGRATTGSEYDLVDLADMAEKMKAHYPVEAEAVVAAVADMVVHNVTNTEGCCGLSIYYPFYNKSYYQKAWADVYGKLDVLPAYLAYLDAYAQRWLQNDLLQTVAGSAVPQAISSSQFQLELTQQQAENFADANYYILQREGDQIYTRIHTSSNVVKEGNKLVASFDGNILYAKNKFDIYWIPAVDEHDTVGDYTRYSTYVNLTNSLPLFDMRPEGYQHQVAGHRFHISVNNKTNAVKTAALVPYATEVETENLVGGKQEDADLSAWSEYYFLQEDHLYLRRDENGTILPLDQWEVSSYLSANVSRVGDGVEFTLAPIPEGEYYLLFEIEDVQGNRYCSELLPIQGEGVSLPGEFSEEWAEVTWESGDRVRLFEQEGIVAYVTTLERYDTVRYALQIENKNAFDVAVLGYDLAFNETVDCSDGTFAWFHVPAGETVTDDMGFRFGAAEDLGLLTQMKSFQFDLSVVTAAGDRTLIYHKPVNVNLSEYASGLRLDPPEDSIFASSYYDFDVPAFGLQAKNQVVFDHDGVRATLLGMGGDGAENKIVLAFCLENTSEEVKNVRINGVSFDNTFVNKGTGPITIYPGTKLYKTYVISDDDLALYQIASAKTVRISVSHMQFATLLGGGGFSEGCLYEVNLAQNGAQTQLQHGDTLLYEDDAVQIFLLKKEADDYGRIVWTCTMVNRSDRGLMLDIAKVTVNGQVLSEESGGLLTPYDDRCPAGQVTALVITSRIDGVENMKITLTPQFYDMEGEQLLYEGAEILLNK